MTGPRRVLIGLVLAVGLASAPVHFAAPAVGLPDRLSNREFWRVSAEFSEPAGFFNSDNLVSNEDTFQYVIPELTRTVAPGGVYMGVGPDQNFSYIAALDPAVAFIPDLRRGNLQVHLMYKALFALSADRREFLARLFARVAPAGLPPKATARDLMAAFSAAAPDQKLHDSSLRAVLDYLARHRGAALDEADKAGIEFAMSRFFAAGPDLTFVSNGGFRRSSWYPSYAALQAATDLEGVERAYLSTEARFQRVKSLQARNLVIPVVGNFAGAKALTAIGAWVREQGGMVTTLYTSNVEQYLFQEGTWDRFRRNVVSMPTDATSTFIRSCFNSCSSPGGSRAVTLLDSVGGLLETAASGRIQSYWDVLTHSRTPGR
jgi:hypothetical protein